MTDCIRVEALEAGFTGCDVLRGIDLQVPTGSVVALLGENGAGKTTLIRCLTGFLKPVAGRMEVLGIDPTAQTLELRRRVGYMPDAPPLYDWMRVDQIGWFTASFYPDGFMTRYQDLVAHYQLPTDRKLRNLSKGQRAKVALALVLAPDPELLILDEPTSGLDPLVRREFLESMVDRVATGRTVLLSSHQVAEVERVADQIAILHRGKLRLVGPLAELRQRILQVTLTLRQEEPSLPALPAEFELFQRQLRGQQMQLVVGGDRDRLELHLRQIQEVTDVTIRPSTLEEIFVACTQRSPAAGDPPTGDPPDAVPHEALSGGVAAGKAEV
jgi:ABC-2 type transport system ATP-binding protein